MSEMNLKPRSTGFVQAWVRLYTIGLPPGLRDARRDEIDSDLWEQAHHTGMHTTPSPTAHLLLRWLLGLPDDLLWRLAHIRSRDLDPKEGTMIQARDYKTLTVVVMAALIITTIGFNVVDNIEHYNDTNLVDQTLQNVVGYTLLIGGLLITIAGFAVMRRAPWPGAALAIGGVWTAALMVFWLILPLLLAAGVTVFVLTRARKTDGGPL